ncbi:MAG: choline dehydrogenase [Comamonas sp.]|nr:choline dehydrogenase [Comamonas sp.]
MEQSVDYVVIGAGSAGCVLAGRLSESEAHEVCVLEAGGTDRSVLMQCPAGLAGLARSAQFNWGLSSVPQAGLHQRTSYQPRGKVLGGCSSVNAMIYLRGQAQDYDAWAAQGNAGWSWEDVKPWFLKAEHNERGADAFHAQGGPLNVADLQQPNPLSLDFIEAGVQAGFARNEDFNGHSQEGMGLYQVTQKGGERYSAAKAYLTPHLSRPNLHVHTGAQVLRILTEVTPEGLRATGVEYLRAGTRHVVHARREVLLSAGALLSPQLLMLSGIGPAEHLRTMGIQPLLDLPGVGAHLHDHLDATIVCDAPKLTQSFGLSASGLVNMARGMWEWQQKRAGILTSNFAEAGAFLRSSPEEQVPDIQLHFVVAKLIDHGRQTVWGHGFSCHVCALRPESRGTVRLASADPLTSPLIDPNFMSAEVDVLRMVRGVQTTRQILAQPALLQHGARELDASAAAQTAHQIEGWVRQAADSIYHPVGTCRMGSGAMDVVDASLRVHGMHGLRVVDASIFPSIISGNTSAPTVMVAEKAAHMVLHALEMCE